MSKKVVIIGGGIIGLCTAYYLQKEGNEVIIIDQSNFSQGASFVNAGYLSPSHIIPLSAPGVMKKGIKWMFNPASPLYIKPRADINFLKWAWAFNKACNMHHVKKAIPVIKDISLFSQELYDTIKQEENLTFHYQKKGLFLLCQTEKMFEEEIHTAKIAQNEGLAVDILNTKQLAILEPNAEINAIGATYYKCDSHTTPSEFMQEMIVLLKQKGVTFFENEKVIDLNFNHSKITKLITNHKEISADEFVLAAGTWSNFLSKKIGIQLLLQAGKGYRIDSERPTGITIPAILAEAKVAITPMNGFTRFAGTMEIAGITNTINKVRVQAIANAAHAYYPNVQLTNTELNNASNGLRPLSFDGLPYIGKSEKCSNLTIATGHAMMGWTMATGTGKLVSEIINQKKTSINTSLFSVDRKN